MVKMAAGTYFKLYNGLYFVTIVDCSSFVVFSQLVLMLVWHLIARAFLEILRNLERMFVS